MTSGAFFLIESLRQEVYLFFGTGNEDDLWQGLRAVMELSRGASSIEDFQRQLLSRMFFDSRRTLTATVPAMASGTTAAHYGEVDSGTTTVH